MIFYKELHINRSGIFCFLILLSSASIVAYSNGWPAAVKNFLYIYSSLIAALILIQSRVGSTLFFSIFFCLCFSIFVESIFFEPDYADWISGSRNQVVPILISLLINGLLLGDVRLLNQRKYVINFAFIPATLLLGSSILMVSLSGIGAALILYCSLLIHLISIHRNSQTIVIICFSILFLLLVGSNDLILQQNFELKEKLNNLTELEVRTDRLLIWESYIQQASLIFGADYSGSFSGFDNLHNSFLLAHAKFGIFVFGLIGLIVLSFKRHLNSGAVGIITATLLFMCCFRGFFDTVYFSGSSYTFQFFALILLPFRNGKFLQICNERKIINE